MPQFLSPVNVHFLACFGGTIVQADWVKRDATPLGLGPECRSFPRVARPSQPWALGWNPVGIRSPIPSGSAFGRAAERRKTVAQGESRGKAFEQNVSPVGATVLEECVRSATFAAAPPEIANELVRAFTVSCINTFMS